jgi:hypothetical protein
MVHNLRANLRAPAVLALAGLLVSPAAGAGDWKFSLRRTLVDRNAILYPASLQITLPEDGGSSYAVDLGASVSRTFLGSALWTFVAGGEVHRNNQSFREQDLTSGSFALQGQIGEAGGNATVWFPQLSLSFRRDGVFGTKSLVPAASLMPAGSPLRIGFLLGPPNFGIVWQPQAGVEYQDVLSAPAGRSTGHVGRAFGNVAVAVYPGLHKLAAHCLEIVSSITAGRDFAQSSALDTGRNHHVLRTVAVNYYFDPGKHYALGFSWIDGENPSEGLPEQRYKQIAFKVLY